MQVSSYFILTKSRDNHEDPKFERIKLIEQWTRIRDWKMQRIATLTKQLLAGDRATLARAITLVESRSPKWQAVGQELVSTSVAEGKKDTAARGGGFSIFFPIFSFSSLTSSAYFRFTLVACSGSTLRQQVVGVKPGVVNCSNQVQKQL